jgi:cytochrome c biogenesis protein CcmG/thiol:disulfide interchange protein DsbE
MTDQNQTAEPDRGPDEPGQPAEAPAGSRLVSSRLLLHVTLVLIVVMPAMAWLLRPTPQAQHAVSTGREVGETAPDFTVELFDGTEFTLSAHLAENSTPVLLNFWASWCVPCRVEMPAIDAVARQRPEILFLGIAVQDTETAARGFADEVSVSYPLGHDSDGTILEKYPILGLPATWFITADGMVAEQWFGQLDETTLEELIERHHP